MNIEPHLPQLAIVNVLTDQLAESVRKKIHRLLMTVAKIKNSFLHHIPPCTKMNMILKVFQHLANVYPMGVTYVPSMYVCILLYVCICACMYICMYVCMYVPIH